MKKLLHYALIVSCIVNFLAFPEKLQAADANLLKDGSFEGDIEAYWGFWQNPDDKRSYDYYRAYDAVSGYGSYSVAIDASGDPGDMFAATLSSKAVNNYFTAAAGKKYFLTYYARTTAETEIANYFQKADDYSPASAFQFQKIGKNWQKYVISLESDHSGKLVAAFVLGKMPSGSTLYIDGVQLLASDYEVRTTTVSGQIGEKGKKISIYGLSGLDEDDIRIELPYYDAKTKSVSALRVKASSLSSGVVAFDMPVGSFSGIGRIYVSDSPIGQFNYSVYPVVESLHPSVVRIGEDLIISGSGFSPLESATLLRLTRLSAAGEKEDFWLKAESFDSELREMRFRLPAATINGKLVIRNSYQGIDGKEVNVDTKETSYSLKPLIVSTSWSQRGYEQVGDKLMIGGYGLGLSPSVIFYDKAGAKIDTIKATRIGGADPEYIEVATTKKDNYFEISVVSDSIASDRSETLVYLAKPLLQGIKTGNSRRLAANGETMPAARIGDTITLSGVSLQPAATDVIVSFQANGRRIDVSVPAAETKYQKGLSVSVPEGSVSGFVSVKTRGAESNSLPLEIIPDIISIDPAPIEPGKEIRIKARGIGLSKELVKVIFNRGEKSEKPLMASAIEQSGDDAIIRITAPFGAAYNQASVNIQSGQWSDEGELRVSVDPYVIRASVNLDTRVLSIVGYGFSLSARDNELFFEYADQAQTAVTPKIKILGVYQHEEGQEIRIQLLDGYHYGQLRVRVDGRESNEVSFGPVSVSKITRRVEFVKSSGAEMGVLYISGYNFGSKGGVKVGDRWAEIHYRSNFFIIAVVPASELNNGPVIVARE